MKRTFFVRIFYKSFRIQEILVILEDDEVLKVGL